MASINLLPHLVTISETLELDPVLRHLRSKNLITHEAVDEIRNPYTNVTPAARRAALVEHVKGSEEAVQGFLDALHQTGQAQLAELIQPAEPSELQQIEPARAGLRSWGLWRMASRALKRLPRQQHLTKPEEDADTGTCPSEPTSSQQTASERSRQLRDKKWTCEGLKGSEDKCGFVGNWQRSFRWCSHKDCWRYLCSKCIESDEHTHNTKCRVDVKVLHAAAYELVKEDDAKRKKELCAVAESVGQKVSEALQSYLLNQWDQQAPLRGFEKHLLVDKAGPVKTSAGKVSSNEALAAVTKAVVQMGAPPPTEEDVVPSVLKDAEPKLLLARLLAEGGDVKTFLEKLEELEAPPEEQATAAADNETQAMVTEERDELPDLALIKGGPGGDGGLSLADIDGKDVKPEHAPPALLKLLGTSILDEEYNYSSSVMSAVAVAGDELLTLRDAAGWTSLHITAGRGATGLIKRLLQRPEVEVDARANDGCTPLMVAVWNDKVAAVRALIKAGAEVTAKDHQLRTAVHIASGFGVFESLQSLLKTFPRDVIDAVDDTGRTALFNAALRGSEDCVGQLLEAGADQSIADEDGRAPLHAAAQWGHLDVVRLLLAKGPHLVDAQDKEGATPLMMACQNGHVEVANALLDAGADFEVTDEPGGYAAIHWAAKNGSEVIVKELIDRGSRVNFPSNGQSCLQIACHKGHLEVASVLVENGAHAYHVSAGGFSAISDAAQEGHNDVLEFLLARPCNDDDAARRERFAGDALRQAALDDHLSIVKTLIESAAVRADYSHTDSGTKRNQAIHAASQEGHPGIVKYLLSKGASPDATNEEGMTPLMFAAMNGHVECVRTLLEGGASADLLTPVGTALQAAVQYGQAEATALLLKHTAKHLLESENSDGFTVLLSAALHGHMGIFLQLCARGANLGVRMECGSSCLHLAAQEGHGEIVDFILQREEGRALLNAKGKGGLTVLMRAAQKGDVAVAAVLLAHGADPILCSADGRTALHFAAPEAPEVLHLLIQRNKDIINQRDDGGDAPIIKAAVKGNAESVRLLAEAGADLDLAGKNRLTVLHCAAAAKEGALATVEALIAAGADVHKVTDRGWTCLHFAAQEGNADVVGFLLAGGGDAPIIKAAVKGNAESVRLLAEAGADLDLAGKNRFTVLHCAAAAKEGALATVEALIAAGADVHKVTDRGWTCLHFAAQEGNADVVGFLLAGGRLSPNVKDNHDITPLIIAANNGHPETVAVLLSFGADPDMRDKFGDSTMDCAVAEGHADVVRLLIKHRTEAAALKTGRDPKVQSWIGDLPE